MPTKITRSPRAPSLDLEDAVRKAVKLYDKETKNSVPAELAVKHLGYSGLNNGSAARAIASLKFFGLVESNNKGDVAASKDVETYVHAPQEEIKRELLVRWVKSPKVYSELLDEYSDRLPSDQAIKYRLIKMGFSPTAADECAKNFKSSVEFSRYFERLQSSIANDGEEHEDGSRSEAPEQMERFHDGGRKQTGHHTSVDPSFDRIPVRLSKGRKAAIEVPTPLYAADKEVLKRQIDLLFTDDEEDPFS
jgi:hypothetical protein